MVSPQNQSAHAATFAKYVQTAKGLSSSLTAQLDLYMEKVLTKRKVPTDSGARFKDARKIVDLIVEEKYVYDQDKKRFGAARSNRSVANDYVVDGLDAVGIVSAANIQPDLSNLVGVGRGEVPERSRRAAQSAASLPLNPRRRPRRAASRSRLLRQAAL